MSFLTPIYFRVPSLIFGPLVLLFRRKWGFRNFLKKILAQLISYLAFILMGWVFWPLYISAFLTSFSALWWPNIWPKMGFPEFLKTLLAQSISYLAFILMGWVSWPLYIFVFLAASFTALWWPNNWPKMGFPEYLTKILAQLIFSLRNSHLCSTQLQNINIYWIFLDEVGSDQSGGILSPFMGTARLCLLASPHRSFRSSFWMAGPQHTWHAAQIPSEARFSPNVCNVLNPATSVDV